MPKNAETFECAVCDFVCSKQSNWLKHLSTQKHKTRIILNGEIKAKFVCENCNKEYKANNGLWYHKKKCMQLKSNIYDDSCSDIESNNSIIQNNEKQSIFEKQNIQLQIQEPVNAVTTEMFMDFIKHSKEMQSFMADQQKEFQSAILQRTDKLQDSIIELSKNNNTTINTTNNTNNTFNLNVFLNEQCKDALNIDQFLESLQLTVEDLETTGRLGYVLGISRILINKLKELDVYSRPLHCTDYKRETVYIKDQDKWEKENTKAKLHHMIRQVEKKNLKMLPTWQQENPEFREVATPKNEEFVKISLSSIGEYTKEGIEKQDDKILRNVLKEVVLEKGKI
jgi:hypothetical protein